MPVVKMPDGVLVDMPDTPTPEQVQALQQIAGKLEPENPLWHKAKLFGSDVVKGALSLPALAYDLGRDITRGDMPREGSFFPATSALQGSMTQPQTKADQWQSAVTQGVAGALATPAGIAAPVKAAISGGAGGIGAETSATFLGEGPLQRLLGGALGGIGGAATASRIGRAAPQIEELVKQSLKGISPEMLTRAQEFQANALKQGVNTDLAQALSATGAPSEAITAVRNALAHSRYGTQIQAYLHNQPEQLSALADTTVAGLPGKIRAADVAANNLQESSTARLKLASEDRAALWKQTLYETKQALEDTAKLSIQQAQAKLPGLEMNVAQARGKLLQLQEQLTDAKAGDAAAVAAANKRVEEARALVEKLATFTLPRGQAAGNTGRFLDLPQRGQSISNDEITRAVQATRLQAETPPKVQPAPSLETTSTAQALQQAGEQHAKADLALQAGRGELDTARASFREISRVPPDTGKQVTAQVRAWADQKAPADEAGKWLRNLAASLYKSDGTPLIDPEQINTVLKQFAYKLKKPDLSTPGFDANTVGDLGGKIQKVRELYAATFEPLRAANATYGPFTEAEINPLKKGLVGYFAGVKGARPDVAASENKLFAVLNKGEDPKANLQAGSSNIYRLAEELAKVPDGKASYLDGLKTYISTRVGEALPAEFSSNPATTHTVAQNLYDSLFKNRNQYEGLRQAAAGAAKLMGLPKEDVVRGLDNFGNITFALLNNPKARGALSERDILDISRRNLPSDTLRTFGIFPLAGPARRFDEFVNRRTFEAFDQLLTTPEGAAKLAELGKAPVMSAKALTLYSTLGGTTPQVSAGANAPGINTQ